MQVKVTKPTGEIGLIECLDSGELVIVEGDVSLTDIIESLQGVKPNSATGEVNTLDANPFFVLRSLEVVGWLVDWPEVEGDLDDDDGENADEDIIVN